MAVFEKKTLVKIWSHWKKTEGLSSQVHSGGGALTISSVPTTVRPTRTQLTGLENCCHILIHHFHAKEPSVHQEFRVKNICLLNLKLRHFESHSKTLSETCWMIQVIHRFENRNIKIKIRKWKKCNLQWKKNSCENKGGKILRKLTQHVDWCWLTLPLSLISFGEQFEQTDLQERKQS